MQKWLTSSLILFTLIVVAQPVQAQKYLSKTGTLYFISKTEAINIDANNYQVATIFDAETNDIVVIALIKAFEFELATADKHFNSTYMESEKFPKAIFKGKVEGIDPKRLEKEAEYKVKAKGKLTIHGITKEVVVPGKIMLNKKGEIQIAASFNVSIADYKISVPKVVEGRVAKQVEVSFNTSLKLKK